MALLVYPTEDCLSDAQTHGLTYEVEKVIQRVEDSQSLSVFDPFPPPYLVKKKLGGRQGRLIASRQSVGDHAVVVLLAMLLFAPLVSHVPMASLAALLVLVAWNMSEVHNFLGILRVGPKSDLFVLLICFGLTVFVDMVAAITVGTVLAAILFMRRMSELTESHVQLDSSEDAGTAALPKGVMVYEINGPLFFGAAQKAMGAFNRTQSNDFRVLVLHLGRVPVIDVTGLVALENVITSVLRRHRKVIIAGPLPRPQSVFERAGLEAKHKGLTIVDDLDTALALAAKVVAGPVSLPLAP